MLILQQFIQIPDNEQTNYAREDEYLIVRYYQTELEVVK